MYNPLNETIWTKRRIMTTLRLAEKYRIDPEKTERHNRKKCMSCYYTTFIAGQGFTWYTCAGCGAMENYPNTHVPKLCNGCAGNTYCRMCGADIDVTGD